MDTTEATSRRFTVLGVNDDRDTCDCCGKRPLKRVVWLQDVEGGEPVAYGTSCAARALAIPGTWSARDAEKLVCVAQACDERRKRLEKCKADAQREADATGKPVHVCYSGRSGTYYTRADAALSIQLNGFPRWTAKPAQISRD